ncbi:hypothetical protein HanXRQr2_Chr05g0195331 [Helianthus annuus]|uniref:Uncharacterized protein n=1 Tax=Helianthus annuus TaxID=4232 RepID=A0A251UL09_HELAN|nr:hypothetical protein HanXRQr2_Chr05g0195331 [Helianthus annuus]
MLPSRHHKISDCWYSPSVVEWWVVAEVVTGAAAKRCCDCCSGSSFLNFTQLIHVKSKRKSSIFVPETTIYQCRSSSTGPCSNSTGQRFSFATNDTQSKG